MSKVKKDRIRLKQQMKKSSSKKEWQKEQKSHHSKNVEERVTRTKQLTGFSNNTWDNEAVIRKFISSSRPKKKRRREE